MKTIICRLIFSAALVFAGLSSVQNAAAGESVAEYPTRAVKVIVPFAPAGPTDMIARIIAEKLSESLGVIRQQKEWCIFRN